MDRALNPLATSESAPADLRLLSASAELQRVARWVIDSGDSGGMPYLLIDKVNATVYAFNRAGQLQGSAPALLGMGRGDRLIAPNNATMSQMTPQVRITPAGRFVSRLAVDSHGKELLVLDYAASISLHAVVKGTPAEHRAERLKSPTAQDNRISFGCINVPAAFYSDIVSPAFTNTRGIVYVLPETSPASAMFGIDNVGGVASGAQQGTTVMGAGATATVQTPDIR
ncbi:MAG: L,D-transpeptidase [Lysobacteraceae bacterium]